MLLLFHVFLCFYYFCFWLHWIFVAGHWLCLVTESKGYCSCGLWPSHCGDFCCGAQALGPLASAVVAHGHSCSGLCCLPCPRIELISPALTGDSYPLYQQGSPLPLVYLGFLFFFLVSMTRDLSMFTLTKGFPGGAVVKKLPAVRETWVRSLGWEDPLEKRMATHSSTLAWEIPWTGETG